MIPAIALSRIELLKDGASATYGSDAVAGVVNFITRSDFRGVEFQGAIRASTMAKTTVTTKLVS